MFPRGGIPRIKKISIDTTGRFVQFDALSCWLRLKTSADLRLFTSEADFTAGTNYYSVASAEILELPMEDRGLWMKGASGTANIEMVVLHRKG